MPRTTSIIDEAVCGDLEDLELEPGRVGDLAAMALAEAEPAHAEAARGATATSRASRASSGRRDADLGEQRLERRDAGRDVTADQQLLGGVAMAFEAGRAVDALGGREVVLAASAPRPAETSAWPRRSSTRLRSLGSRGIASSATRHSSAA